MKREITGFKGFMKSARGFVKHWLKQNAIAFDQQANALTGGWADETISSRLYRLERDRRIAGRLFRPIVDVAFRVIASDKDHCRSSYLSERRGNHLPPELRKFEA